MYAMCKSCINKIILKKEAVYIMSEPVRISPETVREKVISDSAILVCAYDDEEKFKNLHLEGAISLTDFKSRLSSIEKDQEIIFYCAWSKEASAAGQAEIYIKDGFKNIKVLGGGVEAWKKAGYPFQK